MWKYKLNTPAPKELHLINSLWTNCSELILFLKSCVEKVIGGVRSTVIPTIIDRLWSVEATTVISRLL